MGTTAPLALDEVTPLWFPRWAKVEISRRDDRFVLSVTGRPPGREAIRRDFAVLVRDVDNGCSPFIDVIQGLLSCAPVQLILTEGGAHDTETGD